MEFLVKNGSVEKQRTACLIVGVYESRRLSAAAEQLDKLSEGYLSQLLRKGDLDGKVGQTLLLHYVPNVSADRVLLVGCGKERELTERQYKQINQKAIAVLNETGATEAVSFLSELHVKVAQFIGMFVLRLKRFKKVFTVLWSLKRPAEQRRQLRKNCL